MRGFFVTGTDTGVGKTVLSAALAIRTGYRYWKPIQTGRDDDTAEVRRLAGCDVFDQGIRLPDPVSPHLAAQRAGMAIDLQQLVLNHDRQRPEIVEGAGGALTPINDFETMTDLMVLLELPVVVVTRTTLGTINHTLLTLQVLRARSLEVAGVIMVGEPNADNRAAIEHYGRVVVLAEMPRFSPLTPECLRRWTRDALAL